MDAPNRCRIIEVKNTPVFCARVREQNVKI